MGDPLDSLGLNHDSRIDPVTGKGFVAQQAPQKASIEHASLSGPAPSFVHPDERQGMMSTSRSDGTPRAPEAVRQLSPDELLAKANQMLDSQRSQTQGVLSQGAATGPRDDAGGQVPGWLSEYMGRQ